LAIIYDDTVLSGAFVKSLTAETDKLNVKIANDPQKRMFPWSGDTTIRRERLEECVDEVISGDASVVFLVTADHMVSESFKVFYEKGARKGEFVFVGSYWLSTFETVVSDDETFTVDMKSLAHGSFEFFQSLTFGELGDWYMSYGAE
jgi:hypothetical protein